MLLRYSCNRIVMTSSSPQTRVRSISQYMDTNTAADPVPAYPYEVDVEDDEDIVVDPNVVDIVERESFTSALSPDITCQSPTTTPGLNAMSVSASTVPEPVRRFAAELQHAIRFNVVFFTFTQHQQRWPITVTDYPKSIR